MRLWIFFLLAAFPLEAQFFRPFTFPRTIRTGHFEIIYAEKSAETARLVAGFADEAYARVSALLGIRVPGRISVVITPDTDLFNSVEMPMPYPHIILFDTPPALDWTAFGNSLESVFVHELTHAVSLSSRSGFFRALHAVFGGWVFPAALGTPLFMSEGAAVSLEGLDGTGRANDPLYREYLFQMMRDDRFLSPFQASGVWQYPPGGDSYYWYGGRFSAWLQEKYGMERYAQLWQSMGGAAPFSPVFLRNGFYRHFERVYGRRFADAWREFRQSLWIDGVRENPEAAVFRGPWRTGRLKIAAAAAGGGMVYFLDSLSGTVFRHDPAAGKTGAAFQADYTGYHLALREDGGTALVSSYRFESMTGFLARAVVTEFRAGGGRTGRSWEHLYHASYFRDGLVGISADGHRNNIVFRPGNGKKKETERILLRGDAGLVYGAPSALDGRWIVFTAAKQGQRELCLYDFETENVYTLLAEPEDAGLWRSIRGMQVSGGRVLFSWNPGGAMYRLALAELRPGTPDDPAQPALAGEAVFCEDDFSGGVFLPVSAGGQIYFRGAFAVWDALMRYPGAALAGVDAAGGPPGSGISAAGKRTRLFMQPWDDHFLAVARGTAAPDAERGGLLAALAAAPGGPDGTAAASENPAAGGAEVPAPEMPARLPEPGRYFGLKYFNPFRLWLPLPLIRQAVRTDGSLTWSLDGGGIFSFMADPIEENQIYLFAFFDARALMGDFDIIWTNSFLGFPLSLEFSDTLDRSLAPYGRRSTTLRLGATLGSGLGGESIRLTLQPRAEVQLGAWDPGDGRNFYSWDYEDPFYDIIFAAQISSIRKMAWETFGTGLSFQATGFYLFGGRQYEPRLEGIFQAALEMRFFPLRLRLYGAWDRNLMRLSGKSALILTPGFVDMSAVEYPSGRDVLEWLAGGEAEIGLFALDIQSSFSHLYFNRLAGTLAWRGAFYDDPSGRLAEGHALGGGRYLAQSLVARFTLDTSTVIIPMQPFSLNFTGLLFWKIPARGGGFSVEDTGFQFAWTLAL